MQVGETSRQRLAELLKELRGERSQRSFAKLLGVSNQAVQYWEKVRLHLYSTVNEEIIRLGTTPITYNWTDVDSQRAQEQRDMSLYGSPP